MAKTPDVVKRVLPWILRNVLGSEYAARITSVVGKKSTTSYYEAMAIQSRFAAAYAAQFEAQHLDVILCPAHVLPTAPHTSTGDFTQAACYTMIYNLLDWPAGKALASLLKRMGFVCVLVEQSTACTFFEILDALPTHEFVTTSGMPQSIHIIAVRF